MYREDEGNLAKGLLWGLLFSIPLWLSILGWIRLITSD